MFIQNGGLVIISRLRYLINSIRFRMIAAIIVVSVIPMLVMEHGVIMTYRDSLLKNKELELSGQLNQVAKKIGMQNSYINQLEEKSHDELNVLSDIFDGRIMAVNSQMVIVYDSYVLEEGKTLISSAVINGLQGKNYFKNPNNGILEIVVPVHNSIGDIIGLLIAEINEGDFLLTIKETTSELYIIRILLIIAIIVIAVLFSGMLVSPIEDITASIKKYSQGYGNRIINSGYSEIAELSDAFNKLFSRMSKLDESRQEFVSNVSHELKTPITSIKVLADALVEQKDVPVETYQEFMTDIVAEIDRENKIINDLLALVKVDGKASGLNIAHVNVNRMVENVLRRLSPLASKENIEITYESFRNVEADIDEVKLSLAVTNLVENAIKYNKKDGWIKVSLNADYKYFYIQVEDSGIGISRIHHDKIFDRFYRVDKTRSRETGGTGLGLAITKETVTMHNGSIKLESKENEGTKFIMRIPLGYSQSGK